MASSFQIEQAGTSYRSGELQPAVTTPTARSRQQQQQHEPSTSYYVPVGSGYQSPPMYSQPPRPVAGLVDESQEGFKDKSLAPPVTFLGRTERVLGLNDFTNSEVWRGSLVELVVLVAFEFTLITGIAACTEAQFDQPGVAVAVVHFLVWSASMLAALSLWVGAGHLNPAFTCASMLTGHITPVRAMLYMAAQSVGSIIGTFAAKQVVQAEFVSKSYLAGCLLGDVVRTSRGLEWPEGLSSRAGLVSEITFSLLLLLVAYASVLEPAHLRRYGPVLGSLAVGAALGLLTFVSRQLRPPHYTGAGMNPARCLGPAIVLGSTLWDCHWLFWVGPFVAAAAFALLYRLVVSRSSYAFQQQQQQQQMMMMLPDEDLYPPHQQYQQQLFGAQQQQQQQLVPSSGGIPVPAAQQAQQQEKRMDVFLHIKAMLHRSESERERSRSRSMNLVEDVPVQQQQQQQQQQGATTSTTATSTAAVI